MLNFSDNVFFYLSNIFINNESLKKKLQSLIQCCFAKEKDDQLENNESETCKSKICKFETCNLEKQYLVNRAIDQICYYDKSATINKRRYKFCQMLIFILTAFITLSPIVNNEIDKLQPPISATWISAVCGAIIMVITNFVGMNKFHHLMTEHRIVCENIKSRTIEYLCSKHPNDKFKD